VLLILGRNPFALPCAGPFIVALLAISVAVEETVARMLTFVAFGLGMGAPIVVISLLGATRARSLTSWLTRHHLAIGRVAGVLLIVAALAEPARGWLEWATMVG
jgi:cytochrome c-type biogenesis protein